MRITKDVFIGALGGAILLVMFQWCFYWAYYRIFLAGQTLPPITLLAFARGAPLGMILGAITYPGLLLIQSGQPLKAARLYLIGGSVVTLLLLAQIGYFINLVMGGGGRGSTTALGPLQIPTALYLAAQMLIFNLPLQWALILIGSGLWMRRYRRHDTW